MVKELKVGQYYCILDRTAIFGEITYDDALVEVGEVFKVVKGTGLFEPLDAYRVSYRRSNMFKVATKKQVSHYKKHRVLNNKKIHKLYVYDKVEY